ncbi:MAG: hypothetical protein KAT65_13970 [Methanophagales archaeon]|nr:hypothetical protein [Methanophagales archaeon]
MTAIPENRRKEDVYHFIMTLIVHIPYKLGIVIVSDQKNTYLNNDFKPEYGVVDKSLVKPDMGYVLVCAGDTLVYQNMFHTIRTDTSIDCRNIRDRVKEYINAKLKEGRLITDTYDIELLIVTKNGDEISSLDMLGATERGTIRTDSFTTIGSHQIPKELVFLKFHVENLELDDAISFGLSTINFVSGIDDGVGHTNEYGASIIIVEKDGGIRKENRSPEDIKAENIFKCVSKLISESKIKD